MISHTPPGELSSETTLSRKIDLSTVSSERMPGYIVICSSIAGTPPRSSELSVRDMQIFSGLQATQT